MTGWQDDCVEISKIGINIYTMQFSVIWCFEVKRCLCWYCRCSWLLVTKKTVVWINLAVWLLVSASECEWEGGVGRIGRRGVWGNQKYTTSECFTTRRRRYKRKGWKIWIWWKNDSTDWFETTWILWNQRTRAWTLCENDNIRLYKNIVYSVCKMSHLANTILARLTVPPTVNKCFYKNEDDFIFLFETNWRLIKNIKVTWQVYEQKVG